MCCDDKTLIKAKIFSWTVDVKEGKVLRSGTCSNKINTLILGSKDTPAVALMQIGVYISVVINVVQQILKSCSVILKHSGIYSCSNTRNLL